MGESAKQSVLWIAQKPELSAQNSDLGKMQKNPAHLQSSENALLCRARAVAFDQGARDADNRACRARVDLAP